MAKAPQIQQAYGIGGSAEVSVFPLPFLSQRAPTTSDFGEIGQIWIYNGTAYMLLSIIAGVATWGTSPASGVGDFDSLSVDPGNAEIVTGDLTVSAGDFEVSAGNTVLGGDLNVAGTVTITGTIDFSSAAAVEITSTADVAPSIFLHANGGTSEQILLHSDQGTGVASVSLLSDVGGITLRSTGLASADAINLEAAAGGIDIDSALLLSLTSTRNNAQAILVEATAGGIDISATGSAGEDIDILATGSSVNITATENAAAAITMTTNGGTSETIVVTNTQGTSAASINLVSTVGGITLTSNLATADGINLNAIGGGVDIDGALQVNIASSQNAADAIVLSASAGGIDITAVGTAGEDIDITATGSSVNITATENAAAAITMTTNGGTSETIVVTNTQGTSAAAINLTATVGGITLTSNLATADGVNINAVGGGVDIDGALQVNIASAQAAAANSVRIVASAADGGMDIDAGTGGMTLDTTGAFSIDGAAASNVTVTGAGIDLTLASVGGSVLVSSTENAAAAVSLYANGGTSETILIRADQGTGLGSIALTSDVGGVTVTTGALAATTGLNLVQGAANASIQVGAGVPGHSAPQGTLYLNTTGSSTSTRAYINTNGSTGWAAVTTAS